MSPDIRIHLLLLAAIPACVQGKPGTAGELDSAEPLEAWLDQDGDGWGAGEALAIAPDTPGYAAQDGDCDDSNSTIHPGAREVCYDGVVNDCDGALADAEAACSDEISGEMALVRAGYGLSLDNSGWDKVGEVMSGGGDLDGDGWPDIAIGNYGMTQEARYQGAVYVFRGPISSGHTMDEADATLSGSEEGELTGYATSIGPDIDGDGYDDLLIGSPGSSAAERAGVAQLVLGPLGSSPDLTLADGLLVGAGDDHAGTAALLSADCDGDDNPDLLVGGEGSSDGVLEGGAVWLVPGPALGSTPLEDAPAEVVGLDAAGGLGTALAAGDATGDGVADILIGEASASCGDVDKGLAALFDGPISGLLTADDGDAVICGKAPLSRTGAAVSLDGDVDGDGLKDILVGSPGEGPLGWEQGEANLILSPPPVSEALVDADASFEGSTDIDIMGCGVSDGADFDGDGLADPLIGSPGIDGAMGAAFLYLGPVSGVHDASDADLRAYGAGYGFDAGHTVASAGDTDLDGRDELLVGSPVASVEWVFVVNGVEGI